MKPSNIRFSIKMNYTNLEYLILENRTRQGNRDLSSY